MLIHDVGILGPIVVTDGGSIRPCYSETIGVLWDFLNCDVRPRGAWAWIISHIDYDHYSITGGLIRAGSWPKPKLIVLPGTYSPRVCRETYKMYHMLASILAYMLKIPPPPSWVLIDVLRSVRESGQIIGAIQGAKLYVGELAYRIIWLPASGVEGLCGKLLKELREKLDGILKKCREKLGEACDEVKERSEKEGADLVDVLAPDRVLVGGDQVSLEILRESERTPGSGEEGFKEPGETPQTVAEPLAGEAYGDIYAQAAEELGDVELQALHRDIVNAFSTAYALEFRGKPLGYMTIVEVKEFPGFSMNTWAIWRAVYHRLQIPPSPLLLYLSDLDGEALEQAISYYKRYACSVVVEVAAHHGNAYTAALQCIAPHIIFISRCHRHPSANVEKNFKYYLRLQDLPIEHHTLWIYTGHRYGLHVTVY